MRKRIPSTLAQGQAGVYRVASKLLLMGVNPMIPAVDHGYDLMLEGGIRLQVKSCHLTRRMWATNGGYPEGAYPFHFRKEVLRHQEDGKKFLKTQPRIFSDECDFVILWGIEQDRFWVVPANLLDGIQFICVGPSIFRHDLDMDRLQELRDSGLSYQAIADVIGGVDPKTIERRLKGLHVHPKRATVEKVRPLENRWDLIEDEINRRLEVSSLTQLVALEQL